MTAAPRRGLEGLQVMISISDSPDLGALAMGQRHVEEAMKEIARHLIAEGATLAYGGHLGPEGFTRILFEIAQTYNASVPEGGNAKIKNYLAATVWERLGKEGVREVRRQYRGAATPICLDLPESVFDEIGGAGFEGAQEGMRSRMALTAMRQRIIDDSQALVCLGGRVTGYSGAYPGVLEEIALALNRGRPLFLIGGFGGAVGDAAGRLLDASPIEPERRRLDEDYRPDYHRVLEFIGSFGDRLPANGLAPEENRTLAVSPDVQTIVPLLLRGLRRVAEMRERR